MKKILVVFAFFSVFFAVSCDSNIKFINPYDAKADQEEISRACDKAAIECGIMILTYGTTEVEIDCGGCGTGYYCNMENNKCEIDPSYDGGDSGSDGGNSEGPDADSGAEAGDDGDTASDDGESSSDNDSGDSQPDDGGDTPVSGETRVTECSPKPENSEWNEVSEITQTWNGISWIPTNKSSYSETASTTECLFRCADGYGWDGKKCVYGTKTGECDPKPENSKWNDGGKNGTFLRTSDGNGWYPETHESEYCEDAGECCFACNTHFSWDGAQCTPDQQWKNCSGSLPANTEWNDNGNNGRFLQTWDETSKSWLPADIEASFNKNQPNECHYKCMADYTRENSECINQRTVSCPSKPANTTWNDGGNSGKYTQTYTDANGWTPSYSSTYSAISSGICKYKCVSTEYEWTGESCVVFSSTNLGNICTGQNKCYNASSSITCPASPSGTEDGYNFYGQDAQFTGKCTAQSFTASSNVIVDNNTGLTWEKSPSSSTYTWDNRATHCNELNTSNYAGKSNWRVPNMLEILTIADNSRYNPAINMSIFPDMPADVYLWLSGQYSSDQGHRFGTYNGYAGYNSKTSTYKVLCVSGSELTAAISSDFATSSNGKTVTDNRTGLMWQKEYVTGKTWRQALAYCQNLNAEGYGGYSSGWRLPNKNELASLLDPGKSSAPYSNFPDMPSNWFWSSSTSVYDTYNAWGVGFDYGNVSSSYDDGKICSYNVRCVR